MVGVTVRGTVTRGIRKEIRGARSAERVGFPGLRNFLSDGEENVLGRIHTTPEHVSGVVAVCSCREGFERRKRGTREHVGR